MTVIEVCRTGVSCTLKVSGHSGYAEAGNDIVCSAVSVLVQTLHIGLSDVLGLTISSSVDEVSATIRLQWNDDGSEELRVLTETIFTAMREVSRAYGSYLKYSEVSL